MNTVNFILRNSCNTNGFLFNDATGNYLTSDLPLNEHGNESLANSYKFYLDDVEVCDKDKSHICITCLLPQIGSKIIDIEKMNDERICDILLWIDFSIS